MLFNNVITYPRVGLRIILPLLAFLLASCSFSPPLPLPTDTQLPSPLPSDLPAPTPVPPTLTPVKPTTTYPATETPTQTDIPPTPTETNPPQILRFAVIGDYGSGNQDERDVADLVKSWDPDLIITTGDNNYPDGASSTIDENIGQFYHEYIAPYQGSYGAGGQENRFFPSLGNHDWNTAQAEPYLEYFTLPGNERYYDFIWGPVHFFAIDSDSREPDGVGRSSVQALWLQSRLEESTSSWKIVYFHHAAYSSGFHGNVDWMQWPFAEWGADVVLSGHDHTYERISRGGITYFVNGLGGMSRYTFIVPVDGSQVRYNRDYGAMRVEASESTIQFQFVNRLNEVIDTFEITR
ncbi:MAG: metallophosphoesterase [Chloroflexota bacterium]|nr:MAG: metallophosphoesterase [Chloroflexota bacterium]